MEIRKDEEKSRRERERVRREKIQVHEMLGMSRTLRASKDLWVGRVEK